MTGTNLASLVRQYTSTSSTTFTDANMLPIANNVKNEFAMEIEKRNAQYFVVPTLFDLVASSVTAREYSWPDDVLSKIISIEIDTVGTASPLNYVPCRPYRGGYQKLLDDLGGLTEANISGSFGTSFPRYFLTRRGFYLLCGTISSTITNGGRLRYKAWPADLANLTGVAGLDIDPTTTTFGIPIQFHELWARRTSIVFKGLQPRPIPLTAIEQQFAQDFEKALQSIERDDDDGEYFGTLPGEYRHVPTPLFPYGYTL